MALTDLVLAATESDFQTFLQIQMIILGTEGHGHPGSQLCMTASVLSTSHCLALIFCSFSYSTRQKY